MSDEEAKQNVTEPTGGAQAGFLDASGRALQAAPSRRGVLVSGAIVLLGFAVLSAANYLRLDHLTSDQFTVGAVVQRQIDPELFQDDPTYGESRNYQWYLPWYRNLLVFLSRLGGDISMGYWLLMVACSAITLLGFWILFLRLDVNPLWAAGGAILTALPRLASGQEISGACAMETALPRTMFSMLLPIILLVFFRSHMRGWRCVLSFLLIGLFANAHPISGMFLSIILLSVVLYVNRARLKGWLKVAGAGLAAAIGILPFVLSFQWKQPAEPLKGTLLEPFGPPIPDYELLNNTAVFALCVAPLAVTAWLVRRHYRKGGIPPAAEISFWCVCITLVIAVVGGVVSSLLLMVNCRNYFTHLHWMRATRLIAPFAIVSMVVWAGTVRAAALPARRALLIVGLTLLPIAATVGGLEYVFFDRYQPLKAQALIAAKDTPPNALLLVPPKGGDAFRVWSRRATLWTKPDLHFQFTGNRRMARDFNENTEQLYHRGDIKGLLRLARQLPHEFARKQAYELVGKWEVELARSSPEALAAKWTEDLSRELPKALARKLADRLSAKLASIRIQNLPSDKIAEELAEKLAEKLTVVMDYRRFEARYLVIPPDWDPSPLPRDRGYGGVYKIPRKSPPAMPTGSGGPATAGKED